jgi:SAM-dependent methyltransferase
MLPIRLNAPIAPLDMPLTKLWVTFICNVCAAPNITSSKKLTREDQSCFFCKSNVRFRTVVEALSQVLYGRSIPLPFFPKNKRIHGLGLSDWHGYAVPLARKLDYINTFLHCEPTLDILRIPQAWEARFDFLISSDIFEHIVSPVSKGFENSFRLLKPGGSLILTVPFVPDGITLEHYKELHNFEIVVEKNGKRLKNISRDGVIEWYDNLIFHGGAGATLEMRVFSLPSLLLDLQNAGFTEIKTYEKEIRRYGIPPAGGYSFPITARRPLL